MHIENKLLRFLTSVFLALLVYSLLVLLIESKYDVVEVLLGMLIFALVGVFIVVSTLIFMTYVFYSFLNKREIRPIMAGKIIKISMVFLLVIVVLHIAAFNSNVINDLF